MSQQLITQLKKPEIFQLALKKLPIAISFVLIALCTHVLWQIAQTFLTNDESLAVTKIAQVKTVTDTSNQRAFNQLVDVNLFGKANKKRTKVTTKVPETKLNLILKGVFASTPMENSTAIISTGKNGKEDSYTVGDKLAGGVTITEIYSDYVILDRSGRSEILRMPESKNVGEIVSVIPDLSDVMQVHDADADMLDLVRNKIIAAPYTLRDYAHPVAVKENNKLIGYRLQPKQKWSEVSDIGVEPDDVVTAVNDVRLNDPKNASRALRELITAKDVFITLRRGNDEIRFKAELQ